MIKLNKIKSLATKTISVLFLLLIIHNVSAQSTNKALEKPNYKNEIRTSFIGLFNNIIFLGYERFFKSKTSLVLNTQTKYIKTYNNYDAGFKGELQFRFYFFPKYYKDVNIKLDGLYTSVYGAYGYREFSYNRIYDYYNEEYYYTVKSTPIAAGGVLVGLKLTLQDKITLDLNLGGGVKYYNLIDKNYDIYYNDNYNGIKFKGNITFGFKF